MLCWQRKGSTVEHSLLFLSENTDILECYFQIRSFKLCFLYCEADFHRPWLVNANISHCQLPNKIKFAADEIPGGHSWLDAPGNTYCTATAAGISLTKHLSCFTPRCTFVWPRRAPPLQKRGRRRRERDKVGPVSGGRDARCFVLLCHPDLILPATVDAHRLDYTKANMNGSQHERLGKMLHGTSEWGATVISKANKTLGRCCCRCLPVWELFLDTLARPCLCSQTKGPESKQEPSR